METLTGILIATQLLFTLVIGLYFYNSLKGQQQSKGAISTETKNELEKMRKLRGIKLSEPLSEMTRPERLDDIVGQEKGIKALRASICSPNPTHVLIYGPPGVGKTAAARIVLQEAVLMRNSPFRETAPFIEIDATTLQFDERSIADPLIGSVHDPIYQGAGAYGPAGIPQPKKGAVTKAHGGVLFIDEIGELNSIQMNKLLKVLEDRKVYLNSSYYSKEDSNIPEHIHDIFTNGLPADFRLIGATTRNPAEIPPALRSRCREVYFRGLMPGEVVRIAQGCISRLDFSLTFDKAVPETVAKYSINGRDTVNIVEMATSFALLEGRCHITARDVEEAAELSHYTPCIRKKVEKTGKTGVVNGLAVCGSSGYIMEIEATAEQAPHRGALKITGIVEEEEIKNGTSKLKRKGTAKASVDNAITVLERITGEAIDDYDLHINFPGGMPVDGPSAGIGIFTAIYSAITGVEISGDIAMTGELSIKGNINPVGGVAEKIEGAVDGGVRKIYIPKDNYQNSFSLYPIEIVPITTIYQLMDDLFGCKYEQSAVVFMKVISDTP